MNNVKKVLMSACLLLLTTMANASFLIEPHLGYNVSGGQSSWSNTKTDYTGVQYGSRLGVQYLGVMGGLDYTHSTFDLKSTNLSSLATTTTSQDQDDLGLFVGYNAPILLRAWLGYYFSSKVTASNGDWKKGTATELGVGFTPLPLFSLNLVYRMLSFDESYTASSGATSTLATKYEPTEFVLGISLPFTLL